MHANLRSICAAVRRRRFLPVLDGGAGVVSGVAHDDVSVPGVVNADEQLVALLPVVVGVGGRLSVWILSCSYNSDVGRMWERASDHVSA